MVIGVIMGVTFVLLFPFGAALIRLLNNRIPNAFALHRGVQSLNFLLAVTGMALGIYRSELSESVRGESCSPLFFCFFFCSFVFFISFFSFHWLTIIDPLALSSPVSEGRRQAGT